MIYGVLASFNRVARAIRPRSWLSCLRTAAASDTVALPALVAFFGPVIWTCSEIRPSPCLRLSGVPPESPTKNSPTELLQPTGLGSSNRGARQQRPILCRFCASLFQLLGPEALRTQHFWVCHTSGHFEDPNAVYDPGDPPTNPLGDDNEILCIGLQSPLVPFRER